MVAVNWKIMEAQTSMLRRFYHVHSKGAVAAGCCHVRGIVGCFLEVKACLNAFWRFREVENKRCFGVVFAKGGCFRALMEVLVCGVGWVRLPVLFFDIVDGEVFP